MFANGFFADAEGFEDIFHFGCGLQGKGVVIVANDGPVVSLCNQPITTASININKH